MAKSALIEGLMAGQRFKQNREDRERAAKTQGLEQQRFDIYKRQKDAEYKRFTETSNLTTMATESYKLMQMTPQAQDEYLEERIIKGGEEGRDMQDSMAAFNEKDPAKRNQMFQNVVSLAEKRKLMQRDPKAPEEKWGTQFKGQTPEGKPGFFQVNKRGTVRQLPGVVPPPPKGSAAIKGSSGIPGLSKEQSEELYSNRKMMGDLAAVEALEEEEFMTYAGRASTGMSGIAEQMKIDPNTPFFGAISALIQPGKEQKAFNEKKRQWRQGVQGIFNDYRRIITGAAAPMSELKQLEGAMLNPNLSWSEYQGAKKQLKRKLLRINRVLRKQSEQNVQFKDRAAYNEWFNKEYQNTPEENANTRGAELKASGMSDEDVLKTLKKEY